ncbi:DUF927 domain-containing protein [Tuwongella immobilis]|nr:DUF927 domain-containing protein [Tuwongella immobilis]
MNWIIDRWGMRAIVNAGQSTRDHLRAAIQTLSVNIRARTVYTHTGWRKVNQSWVYLHAAGAIGTSEARADVAVELPENLQGYSLPVSSNSPQSQREAVHASLRLLELGPDRLMFPILAAVYRAVLGNVDCSLHLVGPSGTFKSEVAALAVQHFGSSMTSRALPASWTSTDNALEATAFTLKDTILVIDDFKPQGSMADLQRWHSKADRVFRAQGNHSARQRMNADSTLQCSKAPRGLIFSTGEDVPRGHSLQARLVILHVEPGDLGPRPPQTNARLDQAQQEALSGQYAQSMAGFLAWLAPQYDDLIQRLPLELASLRSEQMRQSMHARTPSNLAQLALGLKWFLDYAQFIDAISESDRDALNLRARTAWNETGTAQLEETESADPATGFMRLLRAAIAGGSGFVAAGDGGPPESPLAWGWQQENYFAGDEGVVVRYRSHGTLVGWLDEGQLYLEPDASYSVVHRMARDQGECFEITLKTLIRRLKERGMLLSRDAARNKNVMRRTLVGQRRNVLHVKWPGLEPPSLPLDDSPSNDCASHTGELTIVEIDDQGQLFPEGTP